MAMKKRWKRLEAAGDQPGGGPDRKTVRGLERRVALTRLDRPGNAGQLYHHLRQLLAAGWLQQVERGRYEVPANRVCGCWP